MVPILRPLIAPNNTISAYPQNNSLVITDYADNLRRIQRIIESIDTAATSDVELIPVKNGLALEIATVVNRVLDEGARAAGQATDAGQRVSILAEPRTNSIIIRAPSPQRLQLAKSLIAQLDRPALTPGNINVIHLRNAEAIQLAPLLRAIIGADASFVPQTRRQRLAPRRASDPVRAERSWVYRSAPPVEPPPAPADRRGRFGRRRYRRPCRNDPGRSGDQLADHHRA